MSNSTSSENRIRIADLPIDTEPPEGFAPLIRNCWYAIAEKQDVNRELGSIKVLGQPLVFYRSEAGEPIVLDDRCAHRRYALSKGVLIGDNVRCGYHGFTYNPEGRCIWAPAQNDKEMGFGVRAYPSVERGPWLWVWLGHPELANPENIPPIERECHASMYTHNPGNYLLLIENLLDLTHIHFLHGEQAASIEQADEPVHNYDVTNGVGWTKSVEKEKMGLVGYWTGGDPEQWVQSEYIQRQIGPSLNDNTNFRKALPGDEKIASPSLFYVAHAITPEDEYNTHQFTYFSLGEPLVIPPEAVTQITAEKVFADDVKVIKEMQKNILEDNRQGRVEFGVVNDRFGLKMRKILKEMKALEQNKM
jgi:vanillate O-demethylase monooxygenase subunit